jgi:hypothetical protein
MPASASRKDASKAGVDARPSVGVRLMRTALCMAIVLAVVVGDVPASFAQDSRVPDPGKPAGTGTEAKAPRMRERLDSSKGISLAVPIGKVSVGPEAVHGEPIYIRRSTVREGMTIVEVSTTPFMPVLASNEGPSGGGQLVVKPDQPAGW